MFDFIKNMFCHCDNKQDSVEHRHQEAIHQDKQVREHLTERQLDNQLGDTMEASDPVTKY